MCFLSGAVESMDTSSEKLMLMTRGVLVKQSGGSCKCWHLIGRWGNRCAGACETDTEHYCRAQRREGTKAKELRKKRVKWIKLKTIKYSF